MGERPVGVSIARWHVSRACRRIIASSLVALLLAACAPAAAPAPPASTGASAAPTGSRAGDTTALQQIVDGARQEGSLSIIWGAGILGGTEGIQRLTDGMNKQYGLNVEVRYTPGPSMPEMAARIVQEYQAGRTAATDVSVGYAQHMLALIAGDALEAVDWPAWAPNVQDPMATADNGRAVAVQSSTPGITYNSAKIGGDLVPHSLQELLEPRYQGRVASTPFAASFDNLAVPELWGEQRTTDYLLKFADQIAGLMRCNEMDRLASGEYEILAIQCSQGEPLQHKAKGAPLEFTLAADAPLLLPLYVAVPRRAAHPNVAKLWINYLLSREGQDILYAVNFSDATFVPGSHTAPELEKLQATGVRFTVVDIDFFRRNDEKDLDRIRTKFQDILQKRR